ncbi:MAG TPA: hypothetical protein VM617_07090 [Thermoanaerobaculia bacterium]|nr:hypothetical protein [Thermoanaerobaculia bacterium]
MTTTTEVATSARPEVSRMDRVTRQEIAELSAHREGPHVSLFLPTVRAGQETQQNPIRLKNLLRDAANRLQERGVERADAEALLAPARKLLDDYDFWQHQQDGLAVFVAPGFLRTYRLPLRFTELAAVEDRFHLKSLFPLFAAEGRFYILALSQNDVRLLEGSRYEVHEVPLQSVPKSLADALGHDLTETHLQFHTGTRANPGGPQTRGQQQAGANRAAIYHGHGAGEEDGKEEIRKFFNLLDDGLGEFLDGDGQAPLVLAGVEYLLPIYREQTNYPNTLSEGVHGNPDGLTPAELHGRAWALVEEEFGAARREATERYGDLSGTGRASNELDEVLPAALDGRVDTLFVARGVRVWGRFDEDGRRIERHDEQSADSEDLTDRAALLTFVNSGTVHAVEAEEVPGGGTLGAIFRY